MLNGVTDARIERVGFRGFRGDGLHLGSSTISANERHNRQVQIDQCVFDGVNTNNRNGITVIDCDGLIIRNSQFLRCTRQGDGTTDAGDSMDPLTGLQMPGAIDLEPEPNRFTILRDVTIRDNVFDGGGGYAVALNLRGNDFVAAPQRGFRIERNRIRNRWGGLGAIGFAGDTALRDARAYEVSIDGNLVERCEKPFILDGMRGLTLINNRFLACAEPGELGYQSANADIIVRQNLFDRVGQDRHGYALWVRTGDRITIAGNEFRDFGLSNGTQGIAIGLLAGRLRQLRLRDNRFIGRLGRATAPLLIQRGELLDRTGSSVGGNIVDLGRAADRTLQGLQSDQ